LLAESLRPYGSGPTWPAVLGALDSWLAGRPARDLFRLNPRRVAAGLGLDEGAVTDAFLGAVLEGWFDLRWDYHCPHCQGIPDFATHLSDAKAAGYCPQCTVGYRNELDENVEVTFTAAPRLAAFAPGEQESLLEAFHVALAAGPRVRDPLTLSGLDVLHRPLFQTRFSDEVLSAEESLEIRHVVLLFTDIQGSTRLYEQLGDAKAYNLVRDHFKVLFEAVRAQGGIVVKTIGDAVMASFRRSSDALAAALAVQAAIPGLKVPGTDEAVVVKMGLHAGPAIAVTMNDRFDYFGQTVNRAARIQGLAAGQEIYFSEAVFQDRESRRTLADRKAAVRRFRTQLRGIEGDQVVYAVR